MKLEDLTTIDQLVDFLAGTQAVAFSVLAQATLSAQATHLVSDKDACYRWIQRELVKFRCLRLSRQGKGVVIRFLMKISGYSRQQLTRLVGQYRKTSKIQRRQRTVSGFKQKYTVTDIGLLAAMDKVNDSEGGREGALGYERHDTPCGPAVKKLCERTCEVFGQTEYTALASISVSHRYNLRKSIPYTRQRRHFEKTRPKRSKISERRKPQPHGQPGVKLH